MLLEGVMITLMCCTNLYISLISECLAWVMFALTCFRNYILSCVALGDLAEHFHDEWRRVRRPRVVCVLRWWGMYKVSGTCLIYS